MEHRTRWLITAALAVVPLACTADEPADDAADTAPEPAAAEAPAPAPTTEGPYAGWQVRTDGDVPPEGVTVTAIDGGWEIDNGPAVVLWNEARTAEGSYTLTATFEQLDSKGMVHGTGLVFGGSDLDGPDQAYTYFMVRGDGDYLVKTRAGESTAWVLPSGAWTGHDSIQVDDADGRYTNELSVEVGDSETVFRVNGAEVHRAATADLPTDGLFGVRLNHNLTIRVTDLAVDGGM
ncbi:hypothetical protein WI372_15385 [Gemmatimonadota bacterium DH-20]|uniref:3-keto-disaccharide hydrolase domain-containing protein n=1 Tax=Gaopeijia maritima TaxID=3119007 RepID=A0ABU9EEM0_9BACT